MRTITRAATAAAAVTLITTTPNLLADPWADAVIDYTPGIGGAEGFDDPTSVLGSPERFTGEGVFPSTVTPFNSPFGQDELVSLGEGGSITVRFDQAVTNDALNPFGLDLLIFGNAFMGAAGDFSDPIVSGLFSEGGLIELSANGIDWTTVQGVEADGGFPTLGFLDETSPFGSESPGSVFSDFTKPVDPNFDPTGLTLDEIIAGYNGSGGGLGIDIGALGFDSISYVRISNPVGSGLTPEIDAFADVRAVPAAPAYAIVLAPLLASTRRRRAPARA